jgi:TIR domain
LTRDPGHDVFVSYAHQDNGVSLGASLSHGWVTTLAANLNEGPAVLKKRLFIDHHLKPGDAFSDDLRERVQGSSVLLLLLSQNYVDSDWCGLELDEFLRSHGADSPDVFVVELCPFETLVGVPASIQAIRKRALHSKFWYQPPEASLPLLAGVPSPRETEPAGQSHYWRVLAELRGALDIRVRTRREQRVPTRNPAVPPPMAAGVAPPVAAPADDAAAGAIQPRLGTVLLADTTEDLEAARNAIRAALQPEGVLVLPEGDYVELSPKEFEAAIAADLARSDLFVQLLSETAGRKPKGFEAPRPQLQYQRALAAGRPILQWSERLPTAGAIADAGHAGLFQTEFLRVTHRAEFESIVVDHLRAHKARREREAAAAAAAAAASATRANAETPRAAARRLIFIDDAAGEPALSERLRAIARANNCSLRSLPPGAPLGNNGIDVKELLRPCRAGITVYTDTAKYATAYNRLVFFINQVADGGLPIERWGVVLRQGTVAEVFGIESDEVVPLDEAGLANFLTTL